MSNYSLIDSLEAFERLSHRDVSIDTVKQVSHAHEMTTAQMYVTLFRPLFCNNELPKIVAMYELERPGHMTIREYIKTVDALVVHTSETTIYKDYRINGEDNELIWMLSNELEPLSIKSEWFYEKIVAYQISNDGFHDFAKIIDSARTAGMAITSKMWIYFPDNINQTEVYAKYLVSIKCPLDDHTIPLINNGEIFQEEGAYDVINAYIDTDPTLKIKLINHWRIRDSDSMHEYYHRYTNDDGADYNGGTNDDYRMGSFVDLITINKRDEEEFEKYRFNYARRCALFRQ